MSDLSLGLSPDADAAHQCWGCQPAALVFKTSAFDHSATPPGQRDRSGLPLNTQIACTTYVFATRAGDPVDHRMAHPASAKLAFEGSPLPCAPLSMRRGADACPQPSRGRQFIHIPVALRPSANVDGKKVAVVRGQVTRAASGPSTRAGWPGPCAPG